MRCNSLILASLAAGPTLVAAQLNQLAQAAGLRYFGTVTTLNDQANPVYKPIVNDRKEFGQWTDYYAFSWKDTEATQGKFTFDSGDRAINLALSQKQLMRCSSLVDVDNLPDWLTQGTWTKASLRAALQNHITRVVRHFRGRCYSWDVVSHATYWLSDSYAQNVLYDVLGPEYISIAFKTAKAADPSAKLYYATRFLLPSVNTTTGALQVINQLKTDRAPIDGVALEYQAYANHDIDEDALVEWLNSFTSLGLDVAYAGLQINLLPMPETECFRNQRNGVYQTVIGSCQRVCRCVGVTVSNYNVLFDSSFNKSSAYTAIASKLKDSHQPCGSTPTKNPSTTAATSTPTSCPMPPLPHWAQCGGTGWLGSTVCEAPYTCVVINVEYSQCL